MENKTQLTSPPKISTNMENPMRRPGSVQDSLRFSYDFDIQSALQYSEDGRDIDFQFEQYPEYQFRLQTPLKGCNQTQSSTIDNSMNRKLEIFEKYRHRDEEKQNDTRNDIVESFDQIFNIKDNIPDQNSATSIFKKKDNFQLDTNGNSNHNNTNCKVSVNSNIEQNKSVLSVQTNHSNANNEFTKKTQKNWISVDQRKESEASMIKNQPSTNATLTNTSFIIGQQSLSKSNMSEINTIPMSVSQHFQTQIKNQPASRQSDEIKSTVIKINQLSPNNFIFSDPKTVGEKKENAQKLKNSRINADKSTNIEINSFQIKLNSSSAQNLSLSIPNQKFSFINTSQNSNISLNTSGGLSNSSSESNMYIQQNLNQSPGQLIQPFFEEQSRIPPFMRKIRQFNSIYPNFNHPNTNLQKESKYCNFLATIFQQAFLFLEKMTYKALDRAKQPKYFPYQMASLNYFVNSQWERERLRQWNILNENLRPRINFARTQIDEIKIRNALSNYKEVIIYYKQRKIDLSTQEGIKSYFRIRQKFWSLQKNMRSISEDVYRIYQQTQYPNFYFEYLKVLRSELPSPQDIQLIKHHQQILKTLLLHRQRMEPLSSSEVGQAVKIKLERELKFLRPF